MALLFYSGLASAELAYLCFVFLRFWLLGPGGEGVRLFGEARQYIMPVIGSRNTRINTTEKQAAYNLHYVNIALGTVFPGVSFCLSTGAALAGFVFTAEDLTT